MAYHVELHIDEHNTGLIVFNHTTNRHLHSISAGNSPASYITEGEYVEALAIMHAAHKKDRGHQFVLILWYTLEKWKADLAPSHPKKVRLVINPVTVLDSIANLPQV